MAPTVRPENSSPRSFDRGAFDISIFVERVLSGFGPGASTPAGTPAGGPLGQGSDSLNAPDPTRNFATLPNLAPLLPNPRAAARAASNPATGGPQMVAAPLDPPTQAELRRAKRALERLGYRPGRMDSPRARAELAQYQQAVGLTNQPQGELTDRTLASLEKTARRVRKHRKTKPYFTQGMKGARIKKLQQRLQRLGDFEGTPNGVYGPETSQAVLKFRKRHPNIPQGIRSWGPHAQEGLKTELGNMAHDPYRSRAKPSRLRRQRDAAALQEARTNGIGPDSPKHVIRHFQRELKRAGYDANRYDGKWTDHTAAMARQFERRAGITHEGTDPDRFGDDTWRALSKLSMETNSQFSPVQKIGEKSDAVLREERRLKKAGINPGKVDGIYTRATERAADRLRRHFGIREDRDGIGGATDRLITKRLKQLRGIHKPIDARLTPISEFLVPDAEGAPSRNGGRFHAGKDWFAPGGSRIESPINGKIVEVRPSSGNSGQVFGGTVKVQGKNGRVWVFRHVNPGDVHVGQTVRKGQGIARITNWADGPDHAHIEVWKTLSGGYRLENMIDPMRFLRRFL